MKVLKDTQLIDFNEVCKKNLHDKESREVTAQFTENELRNIYWLMSEDEKFLEKCPEVFNLFCHLAQKNM